MRRGLVAAALAVLVAAAVASAAVAKPASQAAPQQAECTDVSLGFLGPLTGPAAFIGNEQLSWLRFAAQKYNAANNTQFDVALGDTELKAPVARRVARGFVGDRSVMAVIGGSTSQSVISSAGLFRIARLASISPSATRVDLTNGRYPTFFRVVPHDGVQAPDIARYIATQLRANRVVVLDSQDDYRVPLSDAVQQLLRGRGVTVAASRPRRRRRLLDDRDPGRGRRGRGRLRDADRIGCPGTVRSAARSRASVRSCSERTARTRRASTSRATATCRRSPTTSTSCRPRPRWSASTTSSPGTRCSAPSGRRPTWPRGPL